MRLLLTSCALVFGSCLPAQTASPPPAAAQVPAASADLAAAKARLAAALQKCSQLADTAFTFKWAPDAKNKAGNAALARAIARSNSGAIKGSWHKDLTWLAYDGDNDDELLVAGRRTLAKDGTNDWRLRAGRFADGNSLPFVPDVPLLLQQLAAWDLAVTHREVGSLDDRPVEILSVTLSNEQIADAIWGGLLPDAIATAGFGGNMRVMMMGAAGGNRAPMTPPDTTIDLAIALDPATSLIQQLTFRGWTRENQMARGGAAGGGFVVVQAVGGAGAAPDEDDEDEKAKEKQAAAKKDAGPVYENGLLVRDRAKTTVNDVTVKLSQHGQKQAPPLTDAQKKLLGR
jgi:hypothetical protein